MTFVKPETRRPGKLERTLAGIGTFVAFLGISFVILRYVIGASHTLAWSLAYLHASVSTRIAYLFDRIDGR